MNKTENNWLRFVCQPNSASCNLWRKSILNSSAITLGGGGLKSQKLNTIDNGRIGIILNHGSALNSVSIAILVIDAYLQLFLEEKHGPGKKMLPDKAACKCNVLSAEKWKSNLILSIHTYLTSDKHFLHIFFKPQLCILLNSSLE